MLSTHFLTLTTGITTSQPLCGSYTALPHTAARRHRLVGPDVSLRLCPLAEASRRFCTATFMPKPASKVKATNAGACRSHVTSARTGPHLSFGLVQNTRCGPNQGSGPGPHISANAKYASASVSSFACEHRFMREIVAEGAASLQP